MTERDDGRRLVRVLKPGLLTTVQDGGRWGYHAWGVSPAGPMDPWSHRAANRLVGNDKAAATLETTVLGPELSFETATIVAVAGATCRLFIEDASGGVRETTTGSVFDVPANGRLRFGERTAGTRAYIAVAGGFDVPVMLGSRATDLMGRMGGHQGRALRAGDTLPIGAPRSAGVVGGAGAFLPPPPRGGARLRILWEPQADLFERPAVDRFLSERFTVSRDSNRMGYRLEGPVLTRGSMGELISDATATGHLQVPPSGHPILLMADRQTTGGYPKIGCVIRADLSVAGQLGPGDWVEFEPCDRAVAMRALIQQEQVLQRLAGPRLGEGHGRLRSLPNPEP